MYENFEQLLQKYGVSVYQVSKATGIPQTTFSGWKKRRGGIRIETAQKIADYFGVPLSFLMAGDESQCLNSMIGEENLCQDVLAESRKFDETDIELVDKFHQLNIDGQEKVFIYITDLSKIEEYRK